MGVEVDGAACSVCAATGGGGTGHWLASDVTVGQGTPTALWLGPHHHHPWPSLSRQSLTSLQTYQWHAQKKIKGNLPRRAPCSSIMWWWSHAFRQEKKWPIWDLDSAACHGDDDLFQATCRLLASHHRKLAARETCGGDGNSLSKPIIRLGNLDQAANNANPFCKGLQLPN
jgi:hypothetical protein